jgi:hypothetical protein
MVDAVSFSASSYRAVSSALETRPAVAALAALALPQPITQV